MKNAKDKAGYVNCKLCVQLATGNPEINELPKVKEARVGDVYAFGIRHYAVDIGDGDVVQVPEWGADVEIVSLSSLVSEYDRPTAIHRVPEGAYENQSHAPMASARDPLGFYSELARQVEKSTMKQAPASAWKTYIKALTHKGVKPELFHGRTAKRVQDFSNDELKPMMALMSYKHTSI